MPDLLPRVSAAITRHALIAPGETVVIGVSGGLDSLVLLHLLIRLDLPCTLHAATFDHGIRGVAGAEDAAFVQRIAVAWGVPVTLGQGDVPVLAGAHHLNLEEAARQARYSFLAHVARQVGAAKIAVAHHQDDQAETVLLHLIRGSGLDGLRGMLPASPLPEAEKRFNAEIAEHAERVLLIRPLLDVSRAEIAAYAAEHGIESRHDATNDDPAYLRNRLRHAIMPLLETLNPQLRPALARMAEALRGDAELVRLAGDRALAGVLRVIQPGAAVLDRAAWGACSTGEKRYILRAVIARLRPDLRDVGFVAVDQAALIADQDEVGSEAALPGGLRLRIEYDALIVTAGTDQPVNEAPALKPGDDPPVFRPGERVRWTSGVWTFEAAPLDPGADRAAIHADPLAAALCLPAEARLTLRARRSGDRFRPHGLGGHSQKLSDTLINLRVPGRWRDQVPLLVAGDEIAWFVVPTVAGLRGRVAQTVVVPASGPPPGHVLIGVRWRSELEKS